MTSAEHTARYEAQHAAQHTASFVNAMLVQQEAPYTLQLMHQGQPTFWDIAKVTVRQDAPFAATYETQHNANWVRRQALQHESVYGITQPVQAQNAMFYNLKTSNSLRAQHEAHHAVVTLVSHEASDSFLLLKGSQQEGLYQIKDTVTAGAYQEATYSSVVLKNHEADYSASELLNASHIGSWDLTQKASGQQQSGYDLLTFNRLAVEHSSHYSLISSYLLGVADLPYVLLNGKEIGVESAELSLDEGQSLWLSGVELANVEDYVKFSKDKAFTIVLGGQSYAMIVDSKTLSRDGVTPTMAVRGISPAAALSFPRATPVTKVWVTPTTAKAVAEEVIGGVIAWEIPDWPIPAYRLGVTQSSPLQVVSLLAAAAGGVVEATPAGSLRVRPLFPVTLKDYALATPDQIFTDLEDNITVSEGVTTTEAYDQFLISEQKDTGVRDRIEADSEDGTSVKKLRVYPAPRRNGLRIIHTGPAGITLKEKSYASVRDETQEVEVFDSLCSTNYPVEALTSAQWSDGTPAALTFTKYGTEFKSTDPTRKFGILTLKYKTVAVEYEASSNLDANVQFLVEDLEEV